MKDTAPTLERYALEKWGDGYFTVGPAGTLLVRPDPERPDTLDLYQVARDAAAAGLHPPLLVRFKDILRHRVRALCGVFAEVTPALNTCTQVPLERSAGAAPGFGKREEAHPSRRARRPTGAR